jgi:hypothetical protein
MGREELVLLARILVRLGTEAESTVLSTIQYRPCCFPPPSLIRRSMSRGWVVGSKSSPWCWRATEVYSLSLLWTLALVYASCPSVGF